MRVAYVCADRGVPVFGRKGCSIHVQEVIRSLITHGARVELIAARLGGPPPGDFRQVSVHTLPAHPERAGTAAHEQASIRANSAVRRVLHALGPVDLLYERYSLWSFAAMGWARDSGIPGLLEVNAPLVDEQAAHRVLCNRDTALRIAGRNFSSAHRIIAVSRDVARWVESFPDTQGRVFVIPNGVDPSRFIPTRHDRAGTGTGRNEDLFTIGFVGTLKAWHGLPLLVDAFSELHAEQHQSRLVIVGDGPERAALEERLRARNLHGAVVLTGAVDPRAVPALLASMDVAVAPYSAKQPFYFSPLKVLEYMAAGLPVVASRVGQLEELITDHVTGLLYEPDDTRALAACVRRLRDSRELRQRLGVAARAVVATQYTWDVVVRRSVTLAGLDVPFSAAPACDSVPGRTEVHA
jgi:glycosyltransferase involved in cell wall biosynthesis